MKNMILRKKLNRRADDLGFDFIIILPLILFITLIFLSYVFFVRAFINSKMLSAAAETDIYFARIEFSDKCFAFYDTEIGRAYPGIIDLGRLNNKTISECINFTISERFAMSVNVSKISGGNETVVVYAPDTFDLGKEFIGASGPGSYSMYRRSWPVVIRENENSSAAGVMDITILLSNDAG
jgi:hypothetical protein